MRLLVLGSNGLVGSNVVSCALARDWAVTGTYRSNAPDFDVSLDHHDIRETGDFERLLERHRPDAVVNCAALTDVDVCEKRPERAQDINARAPGTLAGSCAARDVRLVHFSTDYVFDGEANTEYTESSAPHPVQVYGESKLGGERAVRASHETASILRLSFVYGYHGATGGLVGFPAWVRDRLGAKRSVPLFTDQYVTPSRAGSVAETVLDLLNGRVDGLYHVASRSCVTPYAFGEAVGARLDGTDGANDTDSANDRERLLERTKLSNIDRPARRPRHTCLNVARVEGVLGRAQPTLADDLDAIVDALTISHD